MTAQESTGSAAATRPFTIVGIAGSLRVGSYNRALHRGAADFGVTNPRFTGANAGFAVQLARHVRARVVATALSEIVLEVETDRPPRKEP